jgi:hypothetical protein
MHFRIIAVAAAIAAAVSSLHAQDRVGADSSTRLDRFARDMTYGTAEALGYAVLDQARATPVEWGRGWPGYAHRVSSNLGEFYVQEITTEGLAWIMNRPLDYKRCGCRGFGPRLASALRGAVTDQMLHGEHPMAVPRIAGAYAGAYAQTTWRPSTRGRAVTTLVNGTSSLAVGALINLYYEFRR